MRRVPLLAVSMLVVRFKFRGLAHSVSLKDTDVARQLVYLSELSRAENVGHHVTVNGPDVLFGVTDLKREDN